MPTRTSGCPPPCIADQLQAPSILSLPFAITPGTPTSTPQTISCGGPTNFQKQNIVGDPCSLGSCGTVGPVEEIQHGSYQIKHDNVILTQLNAASPLSLALDASLQNGDQCTFEYLNSAAFTSCAGTPEQTSVKMKDSGAYPAQAAYPAKECRAEGADCATSTCTSLCTVATDEVFGQLLINPSLTFLFTRACCNNWSYSVTLTLAILFERTLRSFSATNCNEVTDQACARIPLFTMTYTATGELKGVAIDDVFNQLLPLALTSSTAGETNTEGGCGDPTNPVQCEKGCTLPNGFWLGCGPNDITHWAGATQNRDEVWYAWNGGSATAQL